MSANVLDDTQGHRLVVTKDDAEAELIYEPTPSTCTFIHTGVPDAFRGMGIGGKLVTGRARPHASRRAHRRAVVPVCPTLAARAPRRTQRRHHRLGDAPALRVRRLNGRRRRRATGSAVEPALHRRNVGLPVGLGEDAHESERVVDRKHGRVRERVAGPDPLDGRTFGAQPVEHRRLAPLRESEPPMGGIDASVLLNTVAGSHGSNVTRSLRRTSLGITNQHRPTVPSGLGEVGIELGDIVGRDQDVANIEVVRGAVCMMWWKRAPSPRRCLGVGTVDGVERVAERSTRRFCDPVAIISQSTPARCSSLAG